MKNSDEVVLKMAESTDAVTVLQLLRQINDETNVVMIPELDQLTVADEEGSLGEIVNRSDCLVLLAVLGDLPVGIVTINPVNDNANAGELGVAVLKQYWSEGIGTMLVSEAIYWFQEFSSLDHLVLDVFADNERAIALYRKLGFVQTNQIEETDSAGAKRPTLLMEYAD